MTNQVIMNPAEAMPAIERFHRINMQQSLEQLIKQQPHIKSPAMTIEEQIQVCKEYAAKVVADNPLVSTVHFEISNIAYEDFVRVVKSKNTFMERTSTMMAVVGYDGPARICLISVPLKQITRYERIEQTQTA